MSKKNRLTTNSDETDISNLLSGDNIFTIPYFQRAYKWKPIRLKQLHQNILSVIDENGLHFLGAIIVHGRRTNPSDPDLYDVIDGQQRLTTLYVYLAAIIKILCDLKEFTEAKGLLLRYLIIGRDTGQLSNIKLHSCKEDRAQLNYVIKDIFSNKEFVKELTELKVKYLPATGSDQGTLRNNYRGALRLLKDQVEQDGIERLRDIYTAILSCMSVVQIDVSDPTNGPKIFDSLNSSQEPMTIGDLVRNEIFSRIAGDNVSAIERIDDEHWQPFFKHFQHGSKNLFDQYFFPYGLIHNPNLKKSEIYNALREEWKDIADPENIIESLSRYQNAFIDITCGTNFQKHSKAIHHLLRNLWSFDAPSSVYPFLMCLSNAIRDKVIYESDGIIILEIIESFLVRRAICGHEPTGLHAVFKRLWADCDNKPTQDSVITNIRKHRTVKWPTTEEFKAAIVSRPLYGSAVTHYFILSYDRSLKGDEPENVPWIEHVLPENPAKEWFKSFSKQQHENMKDLLANLIPLSEEMNKSVSNKAYSVKRARYLKDSMFKSTREFAKSQNDWNPAAIDGRSNALATWAGSRWKF